MFTSPFCGVTMAEVWLSSCLLFTAVCWSGWLSSLERLGLALLRPAHSFLVKLAWVLVRISWVRFCSWHLRP